MMYNKQLVACIKVTGQVLREQNETVKLPFGSEYSIFLKNLNTRRASVKIEIDGNDVLDGTSLIINAKSELNLERFIKNGNLEKGNRFKFIERNSKVEAARGIGAEDGLIRIEFAFERDFAKDIEITKTQVIEKHYHHYNWPTTYWNCVGNHYKSYADKSNVYGSGSYTTDVHSQGLNDQLIGQNNNTGMLRSRGMSSSASLNTSDSSSAQVYCNTINDAGITAPGSVSDQTFTAVAPLQLQSETHVIVLKLLGETESGKKIEKPITVKSKNKCTICNRLNKATAKFCSDCGAGLEIVA